MNNDATLRHAKKAGNDFVALMFVFGLLILNAFSQITTTKITSKAPEMDATTFDGSKNFLGEAVTKYIGQELYLKGVADKLRKYGYDGFVNDYTKDRYPYNSNVYKCCDSYNSKYDELTGKYFKVVDVIKHPKAKENELLYGSKHFLKLQEKGSGNLVYFEYNSKYEFSFPFIVVAFFEKQKELVVGQQFVFADGVLTTSSDIQTGKAITNITGQKWKCTDLTVEEKYYTLSLILENDMKERVAVSFDTVFGEWRSGRVYALSEAAKYRQKFGEEIFEVILKGKVKIGMTKEMCQLSWGKPKSINETITSGKTREQWVYSDNYLYFDNGILTVIQ